MAKFLLDQSLKERAKKEPTSMLMLTEIYCFIDDFCKEFMPEWEKHLISSGLKKRNRKRQMSYAEVMTILILFHQSHYRNFKWFYREYVSKTLNDAFPNLVSYNRFVESYRSRITGGLAVFSSLKGCQLLYSIPRTKIHQTHSSLVRQSVLDS